MPYRPAPRLLRPALASLAAACLLLAACTDAEDSPTEPTSEATTTASPTATTTATATATTEGTASPVPTFPPAVEQPRSVGLAPVYESVVLERPVELLGYPLGGFEMALVEQGGMVYGLREGEATPILDLRDRVQYGGEEGLLSMALDPQFSANRHAWLYYSAPNPRRTVLSRFSAAEDGTIDPASELVVLEQAQPYSNHNGGAIRFGPDAMLYLGLGDGGSGGDPQGNAQNLGTLLGKVIRLDVSDASEAEPYRIPADNPFVADPDARDEVWAYGIRNPWRMTFDPATGELWGGDVGQEAWEEIDVFRAGENYGWPILEGEACYNAATCDRDGLTPPVAVYGHGDGRCSVTGGVVARHAEATAIEGTYVYGDHCSGELWALPVVEGIAEGTAEGVEPVLIASGGGRISSISQVDGEVYVLRFGEPVARLVDQ